jgi:SAM-dependent methyltransferase
MRTLRDFRGRGGTTIFVSHAPAAVSALCERACVLDRGEIYFDGPVAAGLARYDALVGSAPEATTSEPRGALEREPGFRAQTADAGLPDSELDLAWHRRALGPLWAACGDWAAALLRAEGLQPSHFVLDFGCGSLSIARHLLPYMEQSHYWGFDLDRDLFFDGATIELVRVNVAPQRGHFIVNRTFDLSECPYDFDYVIAGSFFNRLPLHDVARALASVRRKLRPSGRMFVTWLENPDPASGAPISFPFDVVARPDTPPYWHSFAVLSGICSALGFTMTPLPDARHPRGESAALITPAMS